MPETYARHLQQQRDDARSMEAVNTLNRAKRGIVQGHEYDGEAACGVCSRSDVLQDSRGARLHPCETMKR
eukprot:10374675-Alexandrium_andersonii.AAC.1